jgi:hypothetical protein
MSRRFLKNAAWFYSILAALSLALLIWGLARPTWINRGRVCVSVTDGYLDIAWGSCAITRQSHTWTLRHPPKPTSLSLEPNSAWLPSTAEGFALIPATGTFLITVLFIPLWPWMLFFGACAAFQWLRCSHIFVPGRCRKCGYDLEGLSRCPECGTPS